MYETTRSSIGIADGRSTVAASGGGVIAVEETPGLFGPGAVGVAVGEALEQKVLGVAIAALTGLLGQRVKLVGVWRARLTAMRIAAGQDQARQGGGKKW
jgi:hypothetical protein